MYFIYINVSALFNLFSLSPPLPSCFIVLASFLDTGYRAEKKKNKKGKEGRGIKKTTTTHNRNNNDYVNDVKRKKQIQTMGSTLPRFRRSPHEVVEAADFGLSLIHI